MLSFRKLRKKRRYEAKDKSLGVTACKSTGHSDSEAH